MAASQEFLDHLIDLLSDFGYVEARRMFGGAGLFRENLMFALIVGETVYFKTDDDNRRDFEDEGLEAFSYDTKKGVRTINGLMRAPERCLDDSDEMLPWAQKAFAAAVKADAKKKAPKRDQF